MLVIKKTDGFNDFQVSSIPQTLKGNFDYEMNKKLSALEVLEQIVLDLERNDQVLIYDITNPTSLQFLQILCHSNDKNLEGLLMITANGRYIGNDLLVVSKEDSGTVTIYKNN
jgi:hypothetical protein